MSNAQQTLTPQSSVNTPAAQQAQAPKRKLTPKEQQALVAKMLAEFEAKGVEITEESVSSFTKDALDKKAEREEAERKAADEAKKVARFAASQELRKILASFATDEALTVKDTLAIHAMLIREFPEDAKTKDILALSAKKERKPKEAKEGEESTEKKERKQFAVRMPKVTTEEELAVKNFMFSLRADDNNLYFNPSQIMDKENLDFPYIHHIRGIKQEELPLIEDVQLKRRLGGILAKLEEDGALENNGKERGAKAYRAKVA